jgi:ribosomal protein L11 methyltransferase
MSSWIEVTVDAPTELSELVGSYLLDLGSPGLECIDRDGVTSLVAYFRDQEAVDRLPETFARMSLTGKSGWPPTMRSRRIDEQDWAENWKVHFAPTAVGRHLQICPPWDVGSAPDRITLIIQPGMAFGTGQHATTRGCLALIEEATAERGVARALDLGTGSGILAIALAKLGVADVCALDNDPQACAIAAQNSEANGTTQVISIARDLAAVTGRFDLIVANLFTEPLRQLAERLQALLNPDGRLLCSGFLIADETAVTAAYPHLTVVRRKEEEGWTTLLLERV